MAGLAFVVAALSPLVAAAQTTAAADETLVLNETAYCRGYVQFGIDRLSPAGLKADGAKFLGANGMAAVRNRVRWLVNQKLLPPAVKVDESNWTDCAYYSFQWLQYGGERDRADMFAATPAPPGDWAKPEFDDSAWLYQRKPLMVGSEFTQGWYRRAGYFRFPFRVADPARANDLKLQAVIHGGGRILINGTELARVGLPQGDYGPETPGADYPAEAYLLLNDDGTIAGAKEGKHAGPTHAGEVNGSFDDAPRARDQKGADIPDRRMIARRLIDRKNWERIQRLRDRRIDLPIPARLLRKGGNVLAVEVRASAVHPVALAGASNWTTPYYGDVSWSHGQLVKLELRSPGGGVPSALKRPAGVCLWAEDMHRHVISSEYLPEGAPAGTLRFVGANNGVFSAQIVISTDRELTDVKVAPGELKAPDGSGALPAEALQVFSMVGHRLDEWKNLGDGRGGMPWCKEPMIPPAVLALLRHGPPGAAKLPRDTQVEELGKMLFYDHISSAAQPAIPAGESRPIWVTLKVPADAKAGKYRGAIRIQAKGMAPVTIPVEAEVHAWRIPDPLDFQTNAALEQSPYGVALQYNVAVSKAGKSALEPLGLWSQEHFRLMEGSFRQLALVGNDWLNIPVISCTEFGNVKDSMVPWIRRPDGGLAFEYAILDRYLDLAVKHLGRPRVINFVVMHGAEGDPADIQVKDESTGAMATLKLDNRAPDYESNWKAFASSLYAHLRQRGLEKSVYWGFLWDSVADPELIAILAAAAPGVKWTSGAHRGKEHYYVDAYSQLLPFHLTEQSAMGWRARDFHVLLPRGGGSLVAAPGVAFPFNFRLAVDRSLVVGMNGIGRMGADYWGDSYIKGLRQEGFLRAGMPNHYMLWPGPAGAEPSARFMALREGFQECEARIFLEQTLVRKALPDELAARVRNVLFEHHRGTLFVPSMDAGWQYAEMCRDWQERSRRLFGAAAEAAGVVGMDLEQYHIEAGVPARGKATVGLRLREWSGQGRDWKMGPDPATSPAAIEPWVVPAQTSGKLVGQKVLPITLDATRLAPGRTATATIGITDLASGAVHPVTISAAVSKVFDTVLSTSSLDRQQLRFIPDDGREVINVVPGKEATQTLSFFNKSGAEVSWRAWASLPWLAVESASGKAAPGALAFVKVTAKPSAQQAARHEGAVTIAEEGGPAQEEIPLVVYALPAHEEPAALPAGEPVLLDGQLHKALLKSRREWIPSWCAHEVIGLAGGRDSPPTKDGKERGKPVENVFTAPAPQETSYRLEGKGFRAFSAKVDLPLNAGGYKYWDGGRSLPPEWVHMRFEVYVDGQLRASSGWLGPADDMQTLVVPDLAGAKELRLVTRYEKYPPSAVTGAWWDIRFYK